MSTNFINNVYIVKVSKKEYNLNYQINLARQRRLLHWNVTDAFLQINLKRKEGSGMIKYILKRLLIAVPIFIGITFAVFMLSSMAPGNIVDQIVGSSDVPMTEEQIAALNHQYGFDRPVIVQYADWLGDLFHGDLGTSYRNKKPVIDVIGQRIVPTLTLTLTSLVLALIVGIPLGLASAYKPKSVWSAIANFCIYIGSSMPTFFFSLCLIYLFSVKLSLLPASGMYNAAGPKTIGVVIQHLIMPSIVLMFNIVGGFIKQTRASLLEIMNEEYIKTARAKGLSEIVVVVKHGFRNALIPIVTQIGLMVPFLVGGAVVVENVFAWPGLGSLMSTSINSRDYPVIMGVAVIISVVVLLVNILMDIIYAFIDPRISYDK